MAIRDYLEILWRRKWVIVITWLTVLAVAVIGTLLATPIYEASSLLRVLPISGGGSSDWVSYDTRQLDRLLNTYSEWANSRPVIAELQQRLGLADRPWEEQPRIHVQTVPDTELMQVTTTARDPVVARDAANTLTEILVAQSRALFVGTGKTAQEILGEQLAQAQSELDQAWLEYEDLIAQSPEDADRIAAASRAIELKEQTYGTLLDQYERNRVREAVLANTLSVIEPAVVPFAPSSPRKTFNLTMGFLVGLVAGVALAFLLENLDTRIYSLEQIKRSVEMPILGRVPGAGRREQAALFDNNSPQGEAFRRLRTNLFTLDHDLPLHTVLVTSADPQEGKSTIAANLALSVAQSGRKVVLVDAHLRLPTLHKVFDLSNRLGLSSILERKATLEEALQASNNPGVWLLSSGPLPSNPAELVSSPEMGQLLEQLTQQFDMVVLDSPSLLAVTDAAVLAHTADGVILVVERGQARQESVRSARQQLVDVKANALGVVVNRTEQDTAYDYYQKTPT